MYACLVNIGVHVATVQATHFVCAADEQVLGNDFIVLLAFGGRCSAGISLLIGRSLNVDVGLVFVGDRDRLIVADVDAKSFALRVVAVYAPNSAGERRSFYRRLDPFLGDLKRIILVWN